MIVLIMAGYYRPGFRAGGPITTLENLVTSLGSEIEFRIITRNRDMGETSPYAHITPDRWRRVGKAKVFYASEGSVRPLALARLISDTPHDLLYLNSFWDPRFTVVPLFLRKLRLIPPRPVLLAPRGQFGSSAIASKNLKKRAFLALVRAMRLCQDITWQATSIVERKDILREFGSGALGSDPIVVAPNIVNAGSDTAMPTGQRRDVKRPGELRLIYLSRIAAHKNLDYALEVVSRTRGEVRFDIYGSLDCDEVYWERCRSLMAAMPPNISARYHGAVEPTQIAGILAAYDALLLPTKGENFGHVIVEAMRSGCPVVISDRTPWRDLAGESAGWDLPLDEQERFEAVLQTLTGFDEGAHRKYREGARRFAATMVDRSESVARNRDMLIAAAKRP